MVNCQDCGDELKVENIGYYFSSINEEKITNEKAYCKYCYFQMKR